MIDFSQKKYIFFSAIPGINVMLWLFVVFFLIKNNMIKDKIVRLVLGSAFYSILFFMIPQLILDACNMSAQIRNMLDVINISVSIFVIDLHALRLVIKR